MQRVVVCSQVNRARYSGVELNWFRSSWVKFGRIGLAKLSSVKF